MNLDELRNQIEEIDTIIIKNLSKRKEISLQIGKLKSKLGKDVYDPEREKQLMVYYTQLSQKYQINHEYVQSIFKVIISHSKIVQKK